MEVLRKQEEDLQATKELEYQGALTSETSYTTSLQVSPKKQVKRKGAIDENGDYIGWSLNNGDPTTAAFNKFKSVMDNAVNEFYRENTRGEVRYHRTGNNIGVVHIPITPGKSLEKQDRG